MPEKVSSDFLCARCGNCCRGEGIVVLTEQDVARIAAFLGLGRGEFLRRYTRRFPGVSRPALLDKDDAAMSCVFLDGPGCSVHPVKPHQCATFPSQWTRDDAEEICEGLKKARGEA